MQAWIFIGTCITFIKKFFYLCNMKLIKIGNNYHLVSESKILCNDISYHPRINDGKLVLVTTDLEAEVLNDSDAIKIIATSTESKTKEKLPSINISQVENLLIELLAKEEISGKEYDQFFHIEVEGFIKGYSLALEKNKGNKFTLDDINEALSWGYHAKANEGSTPSAGYGTRLFEYLDRRKSKKIKEWFVEIETEFTKDYCEDCGTGGLSNQSIKCDNDDCISKKPKLDGNGCVIIKSIRKIDVTTNSQLMLDYPIQDETWPSRRWNKERTDYVDLSGE